MGKRLIIVGADFSNVALDKLRISIGNTILSKGSTTTLTLSASSVTSPTLNATTSGDIISLEGTGPNYTVNALAIGEQTITCTLSYEDKSETKEITIKVVA